MVTNSIRHWTSNHPVIFPFLAFIIPLAIRTIPEILAGPYALGFDTMAFYIPNTLLWLHNGINLSNFLSSAPLFYILYMPIVAVGGSPVFTLKVTAPVLLGLLGLAMYAYAKKGLGWSPTKSTFVALLGTLYFVALRASWDQLREELSLVFFFVVLLLLIDRKESSQKNYAFLSLAILAAVLSDQVGAVIMFGVLIFTVASKLYRRKFVNAISIAVASLPAAIFFVVVYVGSIASNGFLGYTNSALPLSAWTGFASYQSMLLSEAGFFIYCMLFLLPLVIVSIWRFENLQLKSWLIFTLILCLLPLVSVSPYRWILMLVYPFAFYATEGLSRLKAIKWNRFRLSVQKIAVFYLILSTAILGFGFIVMPSQHPFVYFNSQVVNGYINQIPSSMQQNTISDLDYQSTVNCLHWFKSNVSDNAILLTHIAFYGWALLTLDENQVSNYEFGDPATAATILAQEGYTQIYLIWWVNGQGWYGQPSLPSLFHEVYQNGQIAIYSYNSSLT